jgi:integrase
MSNEDGAAIMRIKGPRRKGVRLGNLLNAADTERLVHAPDTNSNKGKRDRAVLGVLLGGGLRRSEAAQLSVAHLQRREGRWVIVDLVGKHDLIRSVPIPDWTKHDIDEWISAAGFRSGPLFRRIDKSGRVQDGAISSNAIYEIVRKYAAAIGVEIAPHDARRTFAKLAHLGHAGLDQIQLTLGHSSILTTERYLGVLQNLSDAPCDHLGLTI